MAKINLRDYYPDYYATDYIIDVPDEVKENMTPYQQEEQAHRRRMKRNLVLSLDANDGLEAETIYKSKQPDELVESAELKQFIEEAIQMLPEAQARRVYAAVVLEIKPVDIAAAEGVTKSAVSISLSKGINTVKAFLKKYLGKA